LAGLVGRKRSRDEGDGIGGGGGGGNTGGGGRKGRKNRRKGSVFEGEGEEARIARLEREREGERWG